MSSLRRILWAATGIAVLVVGWSFAQANHAPVDLSLVFAEFPGVRLWVVVAGSFAAGLACCGVLSGVKLAQLSLVSRRYRRAVQRLESELQELRNLPLAPEAPSVAGDAGAGPGSSGDPGAAAPQRSLR